MNLMNLGKNSDPIARIITGRKETQIVEIKLEKIISSYEDANFMPNFLFFPKRYRKELFLYLDDPMFKKTSDIA